MKPNYLKSATTIIIALSLLSCNKKIIQAPLQTGSVSDSYEITNVISGNWLPVYWNYETSENSVLTNEYHYSVVQLTVNLLKTGNVLVFARSALDTTKIFALPSTFGNTFISSTKAPGQLTITAINPQNEPKGPSFSFRYFLIPAHLLATKETLDPNDYKSVCSYYHISE